MFLLHTPCMFAQLIYMQHASFPPPHYAHTVHISLDVRHIPCIFPPHIHTPCMFPKLIRQCLFPPLMCTHRACFPHLYAQYSRACFPPCYAHIWYPVCLLTIFMNSISVVHNFFIGIHDSRCLVYMIHDTFVFDIHDTQY